MVKWENIDYAFAFAQIVKDDQYQHDSAMNWIYAHHPGYDEADTFVRFVGLSRSFRRALPMCVKGEVICRLHPSQSVQNYGSRPSLS